MTSRTRYFVIVSLLVLVVGLGTGVVAYFTGFPTSALSRQGGPDELRYVPASATLVAFADVHEVMTSDTRQRLRSALPDMPDGQHEFQDRTGIDIERDIDRVVAFVGQRMVEGRSVPASGMVLARGRFDQVKIESLAREHGGAVEDYKGRRLIVGESTANPSGVKSDVSLAFLEPGLVAIGTGDMVRGAVDLKDGGASITTNDDMMAHMKDVDRADAWVVGRFDILTSQAKLPAELANRLPPITWFSARTEVNGGFRGVLRAEARDDEAANNLRDVVRGFMALAKMQAGSRPEFQGVLQSLQLDGSGRTVAVSFDLPAQVFDAIAALAKQHRP
ncbi:MAG TPA: hypothetical protein VH417_18250 [Vicinamibacterales bacterium]|jgi:hypothetical protein